MRARVRTDVRGPRLLKVARLFNGWKGVANKSPKVAVATVVCVRAWRRTDRRARTMRTHRRARTMRTVDKGRMVGKGLPRVHARARAERNVRTKVV